MKFDIKKYLIYIMLAVFLFNLNYVFAGGNDIGIGEQRWWWKQNGWHTIFC